MISENLYPPQLGFIHGAGLANAFNMLKENHPVSALINGDDIMISQKRTEQKEIIRRLKIQNKKLLEQVEVMKMKQKKLRAEKIKVSQRIHELTKINNSLSKALGARYEEK